MATSEIPAPLTGVALEQALTTRVQERPVLIDGLLYEGTVVLVASDAGVGKSTILLQLAVQGGLAAPVFGLFPCVRPLTVYYLMSERDVWEPLDRLQRLQAHLPFETARLIIDAECVGLLLTHPHHRTLLLHRVATYQPDIVILDPVYGFFEGGMAGDEVAIRIGRFCTALLKSSPRPLGILLSHHNVKHPKSLDAQGHLLERENPYYGSQFLKAYVTGYYDLSKTAQGTLWRRKKDTYGLLHPDFQLTYDPITGLSHAESKLDVLDKRDRFRLFLQAHAASHQPFQASDILQAIPMTPRYLRSLLRDPDLLPLFKVVSTNGKLTVFESVATG